MIRAVLDANVFVSGIISAQGVPGRILDAWRAEHVQLLISYPILEEIERVLQYPKIARRHQWSEASLRTFLADLSTFAILTPGALHLEVITACPADDRYLECAVGGAADSVVSGDRHLLELHAYQGISIVTPRLFLESVER